VSNHLTPSLTLQIIKRLNNPQLGFSFFQFTKQSLNLSYSFWTYNFLLRSLCQQHQHDSAKLVYHSMRADGLLPDSRLLGFLVSSFAFVDRFDVSKEFLREALCNKILSLEFEVVVRLISYVRPFGFSTASIWFSRVKTQCPRRARKLWAAIRMLIIIEVLGAVG
ncbi:hypothetical protein KIW84_035699, partial [Lathyrus oleraceus]